MAILTLQRRLREAGRIRLGQQVKTAGGKTRPAKLDRFRLTSADRVAIEAAAQLYGGEVKQWKDAPVGDQFEVFTTADSMPVVIPPASTAFSQFYETWSGGGCSRRCDGERELLTDSPCLCASEDEPSCKPTTRLSVILHDLPGLGVWRVESHGYYAATELAGTVDVIMHAATRGQLLPATLRLEQRQVRRPGEPTRKFAVPVLDVTLTPTALGLVVGTTAGNGEQPALPPAEGAWQPIEPHADEPAVEVGESIRNARTPTPKRRKNSMPELPATGVKPRGIPTDETIEPADDTLSEAQMRKLRALYGEVGITKAAEQKRVSAVLLGVDRVATHSTLTVDQASQLIDALTGVAEGGSTFTLDDNGEVTGIEPAASAEDRQGQLVDDTQANGEAKL